MKNHVLGSLFALLLASVMTASFAADEIDDVKTDVACPGTSNVGASLDVDVTLTAGGKNAIDLTGKRVMVALSTNPSSSVTRIRTYGPFARTIPGDVIISSGDVALAPDESVVLQVNVVPAVPSGTSGKVAHVLVFVADETGKVGDSEACVVPIQ